MAQDFCSILLWGSLSYLALLKPKQVSEQFHAGFKSWSQGLTIIPFCATLGLLPLEAASLGNGWPDALNLHTLHDIVFESSVGPPRLAQSVVTLAFLLIWQMTESPQKDQSTTLHRFSIADHGAVFLTILSGFPNAILTRGHLLPIFTSAYDDLFTLKIALVAAMVSIALCNRYILVP